MSNFILDVEIQKEILGRCNTSITSLLHEQDHRKIVFAQELPNDIKEKVEKEYEKHDPKWYITIGAVS